MIDPVFGYAALAGSGLALVAIEQGPELLARYRRWRRREWLGLSPLADTLDALRRNTR